MPLVGDTLFILTGGTIDAEPYEQTPEYITPNRFSVIPAVVTAMHPEKTCGFFTWLLKDSKDFTREEIAELAEIIRGVDQPYIVITHGTDRMPENSRLLAELVGETTKTILFTGSMLPLMNGPESDGFTNLRFALEHVAELPKGVGVVMHGQYFYPERLRKDFEQMRFYNEPVISSPSANLTPIARAHDALAAVP
jgi:L-asparaginase/Glu-tRNA(Gln) amidotransferase subunit D